MLMLVSGMEELTLNSISFIKEALYLNKSAEEALLKFRQTCVKARNSTGFRKFDNWFHQVNKRNKERNQAKKDI